MDSLESLRIRTTDQTICNLQLANHSNDGIIEECNNVSTTDVETV